MQTETHAPDSLIISKDTNEIDFFIVLDGEVEVRPKKENFYTVNSSQCFGNLKHIYNSKEWKPADAVAIVDTVLIRISATEFDKVMNNL